MVLIDIAKGTFFLVKITSYRYSIIVLFKNLLKI